MSDPLPLILSLLAGAALGAFFFGGLWWTVRKGLTSDSPALWFFASLMIRTALIVLGIYYVSQNHWPRLVACLIGFLIARVLVVKRLSREQAHWEEEADIASEP